MRRQVALIELGTSHEECLYSQIAFLKSADCCVHLILSNEVQARLHPAHGADHVFALTVKKGVWTRWKLINAVHHYLRKQRATTVVLNTLAGKLVRDLCLTGTRQAEWIGVTHYGKKLASWSLSQMALARKMSRYFVLNDYICCSLTQAGVRKQLQSFYPIFFPAVAQKERCNHEFCACVVGSLQEARRNYSGLIKEVAHKRPSGIRFILAGNGDKDDGPALRQLAADLGVLDRFAFFQGFVKAEELFAEVSSADLLLPLIDKNVDRWTEYNTWRITGAFNLAFGFQKPMAAHSAFRGIDDFDASSVFYEDGQLVDAVMRLQSNLLELSRLQQRLAQYPKFSFEYQANAYLRFVFGEGARSVCRPAA